MTPTVNTGNIENILRFSLQLHQRGNEKTDNAFIKNNIYVTVCLNARVHISHRRTDT